MINPVIVTFYNKVKALALIQYGKLKTSKTISNVNIPQVITSLNNSFERRDQLILQFLIMMETLNWLRQELALAKKLHTTTLDELKMSTSTSNKKATLTNKLNDNARKIERYESLIHNYEKQLNEQHGLLNNYFQKSL